MTERLCLYCETLDYPKTKEHVLQEAFGTRLTLDHDVCHECNTRVFGPVDKELVDHVRYFVVGTPISHPLGFLGKSPSLHYDEPTGLWLSVRVEKSGDGRLFPQLVSASENRVHLITGDSTTGAAKAMLETFGRELEDPRTTFTEWIEDPRVEEGRPQPQLALIRSKKNVYALRACSTAEAAKLRKAVTSEWFVEQLRDPTNFDNAGAQANIIEKPNVRVRTSIHLGQIERALAKVAVNVVCVVSPEDARHEAFRPIRLFALHGPKDEEQSFVAHESFSQGESVLGKFAGPDSHTICLQHLVPELGPCVTIVLYGRPLATIRLCGDDPSALSQSPIKDGSLWVWEFDPVSRTHEEWSSLKDFVRAKSKTPLD